MIWIKKRRVWNLHSNAPLIFLSFFTLKVTLLSKVFIVDAISQERKKKSKIRDTLLGYIILPTLSPNFTKIDGISAENKLRSELKPKHLTRKSDLDFLGPSVLSYTNAFPLHAREGCYPIISEQAVWHCIACRRWCVLKGKERTHFDPFCKESGREG